MFSNALHCMPTDEGPIDESHPFYKTLPAGFFGFGSKKPRSAEDVSKQRVAHVPYSVCL